MLIRDARVWQRLGLLKRLSTADGDALKNVFLDLKLRPGNWIVHQFPGLILLVFCVLKPEALEVKAGHLV